MITHMSLTISWCDVCGDGSLEGDPEQTRCVSCGQSFHVHCAVNSDGLTEFFDTEEENEGCVDRGDCPMEFCPRCQGVWQDPKVKEFANGYLVSLFHSTPFDVDEEGNEKRLLKGSLLLPLLEWFSGEDTKLLIPLDLSGFTDADEEVYKLLDGHQGDVDLRDVSTLSDDQIDKLSRVCGDITLGVSQLSLAAWDSLAKRERETGISAVKSMSPEVAKTLSGKNIDIRIGLSELTPELVEVLMKGEGSLNFPAVTHISLEVVEALVKAQRSIFLYSLTCPEDLEDGEEKTELLAHMDKICDLLRSNEKIEVPYSYSSHGQE